MEQQFKQRHPFTAFQMFRTKQKNLEPKITKYYRESQDRETVIKLARLLQIRDVLGKEKIEKPCCLLVRSLYLHQVTDAMKDYFFYFHAYFSEKAWACLLLSLFPAAVKFRVAQIFQRICAFLSGVDHAYTVP